MFAAHKILENIYKQSLRLIKLLSHTKWESDTETLMKIVKPTILAKLFYGSFLYNTAKNT